MHRHRLYDDNDARPWMRQDGRRQTKSGPNRTSHPIFIHSNVCVESFSQTREFVSSPFCLRSRMVNYEIATPCENSFDTQTVHIAATHNRKTKSKTNKKHAHNSYNIYETHIAKNITSHLTIAEGMGKRKAKKKEEKRKQLLDWHCVCVWLLHSRQMSKVRNFNVLSCLFSMMMMTMK